MEINCVNCKQTWQVSAVQLLAAKIKFGLGLISHTFICPNCQARNVVPITEFESSDHPKPLVPITGEHDHSDILTQHHPPRADNDGGSAPVNPIPAPKPRGRQVHAEVLERGVKLLREHHWSAELMGTLYKGQRIAILDTWTNGDDTWIQIGPERWARLEEDGQPLLQLLDE